jgi:SAM-dependent methyltransferase
MEGAWATHARHWGLLGPPLRPSPEDIATIERVARGVNARRALLLGVTPEIATCAWPDRAELVAVDSSEAMIASVWPAPSVRARARALKGDWRALPIDDRSVDFVVGDGVFTVLDYPAGARSLFAESDRVLAKGGHLVVRAFVSPATREDPRAIVDDLRSGRIHGFHAFRWRLAMALQASTEAGAKVADVWRTWHELVPDPRATFATLGWSETLLETIDVYRDSPVTYWFPSIEELAHLASSRFDHASTHLQRYELGERCPTLVFRAKDRP